jgi:hypothetical protein
MQNNRKENPGVLSGYRDANADINRYFLMVVFLPISASKDSAFLYRAYARVAERSSRTQVKEFRRIERIRAATLLNGQILYKNWPA